MMTQKHTFHNFTSLLASFLEKLLFFWCKPNHFHKELYFILKKIFNNTPYSIFCGSNGFLFKSTIDCLLPGVFYNYEKMFFSLDSTKSLATLSHLISIEVKRVVALKS